jgi:hypothetical protein
LLRECSDIGYDIFSNHDFNLKVCKPGSVGGEALRALVVLEQVEAVVFKVVAANRADFIAPDLVTAVTALGGLHAAVFGGAGECEEGGKE